MAEKDRIFAAEIKLKDEAIKERERIIGESNQLLIELETEVNGLRGHLEQAKARIDVQEKHIIKRG